ncbi:unnamed protein product [Prorocentrum cordatum]|uniref:Uncharacterized protein n=1 Tax=Prorocentrum cordatum TaxID=2364126 RepID=A0ABN9X594_9DINO|nr:unnamed protein product [Polarella glacialis]
MIPLHGRLFKQWMHVAYPRECSFPHVTGTTSPQRAVDWMATTGQEIAATTEEMAQHMETSPRHARGRGAGLEESCGLWTMEEELVSVHVGASEHGVRTSLRPALRGLLFAAAAASASLAALRSCWAALGGDPGGDGKAPPEPARFHL